MTSASAPRVAPLPVDAWPDGLLEQAATTVVGELRSGANVYGTLAHRADLLIAWLHLGSHLTRRSSLAPPLRELLILRTTALVGGVYPFTQHTVIARQVGLDERHIDAARRGTTGHLTGAQAELFALCDELVAGAFVAPARWHALVDRLGITAALDAVVTVGFFRMASWVLNAVGTPLDDGQRPALEPLPRSARRRTVDRLDRTTHGDVVAPGGLLRLRRDHEALAVAAEPLRQHLGRTDPGVDPEVLVEELERHDTVTSSVWDQHLRSLAPGDALDAIVRAAYPLVLGAIPSN